MSRLSENGENGKHNFLHGGRGAEEPAELRLLRPQVPLVLTPDTEESDSIAMTCRAGWDCPAQIPLSLSCFTRFPSVPSLHFSVVAGS